MTAPVGEVTTPTTLGRNGTLRLRAASNSPSSASFLRRASRSAISAPEARELELLDDDLVARLAGEGRQLARRDDLEPLLRLDPHARERGAPDDRVEPGVGVLEGEIGVARGMGPAIAGNLAAHPHIAEPVLDRALERVRQLADGDFGRVARADVRLGHRWTMPEGCAGGETRGAPRGRKARCCSERFIALWRATARRHRRRVDGGASCSPCSRRDLVI